MEKYPHLPSANPDRSYRLLVDDHEFDIEVDRDPYERPRPLPDPELDRILWLGTAAVLVATVTILGITALIFW